MNKIHQKVIGSKCPPFTRTHALKRLRHCAIAATMMASIPPADVLTTHSHHCLNDGLVQQPPLPQQTFLQLIHIMDPQMVDLLLKDSGYLKCCSPSDSNPAIGGPHLLGMNSGVSLYSKVKCLSFSMTCLSSSVTSLTSLLRHQVMHVRNTCNSKFIDMITIHLQSCTPKIMNIRAHL